MRKAHIERLTRLYASESFVPPFHLQGVAGKADANLYTDPQCWLDEALDDLAARAASILDPVVFRPLSIEPWPYGVHFIDRMFGCQVYYYEDNWWAHPLRSPIGTLEHPDLAIDDTWRLARELALGFIARGVTVPYYALPVIASPLNILVNLYEQDVLEAMITSPVAVQHDLRIITDLLCELHRWYRIHIPAEQLQPVAASGRCQPPGFGQICGCTTHLLSASMYQIYIADLDAEVLAVYPNGGLIHLCGAHTQHIPAWRNRLSFRAFQLNDRAAEDLERYYYDLRADQIIYLNPTETMTAERALKITGGQRLVIVQDIA
ncbi:MAG: hypothetical protein ACYCZF_14070 [Anaerolineae bacterium]